MEKVANMERIIHTILMDWKFEERGHIEEIGVDDVMILKRILKTEWIVLEEISLGGGIKIGGGLL